MAKNYSECGVLYFTKEEALVMKKALVSVFKPEIPEKELDLLCGLIYELNIGLDAIKKEKLGEKAGGGDVF